MKKTGYYIFSGIYIALSLGSFDYSLSWKSDVSRGVYWIIMDCVSVACPVILATMYIINKDYRDKNMFYACELINVSLFWTMLIDLWSGYISSFIIPIVLIANSIAAIIFVSLKNRMGENDIKIKMFCL